MKIGLLLPSALSSRRYGRREIFAPLGLAVALADGLVSRGHQVRFYASRDVTTQAELVSGDHRLTDEELTYFQFGKKDELARGTKVREVIFREFEYDLTLRAYQDALQGKINMIHSFINFGAHYFSELTQLPTIYTLHDPLPVRKNTVEYLRLAKFSHHKYVSISEAQRKSNILKLNFIETVYNGINIIDYSFIDKPQGHYLIHFGRMLEEKGSDAAITAAKQSNTLIKIASSISTSGRSKIFHETKILPQIDKRHVQFVGLIHGKSKTRYIGNALAFVFPLAWEEPFGMAMIESMACGTPVIAYNRGSVPEVVRDGVTGFVIEPSGPAARQPQNQPTMGHPTLGAPRLASPDDKKIPWVIKKRGIEGLVEAVKRIGEIDRSACRKHVEENFTVEKMVKGYEKVYNKVLLSSQT